MCRASFGYCIRMICRISILYLVTSTRSGWKTEEEKVVVALSDLSRCMLCLMG